MAVGQPNESLNQMTCKPPQIVSSIAMESHRGDFGATGKWSGRPPEACMQNGEGIGALRTLTLANGQQIIDRLEGQSPMSYTYSIVSSPLPVASYTATMAVTPNRRECGREADVRDSRRTNSCLPNFALQARTVGDVQHVGRSDGQPPIRKRMTASGLGTAGYEWRRCCKAARSTGSDYDREMRGQALLGQDYLGLFRDFEHGARQRFWGVAFMPSRLARKVRTSLARSRSPDCLVASKAAAACS